MRNFVFLIESPNFFIFKKEANKTKFGGLLFIIYIVFMFCISLTYFVDYFINDKYMIEFRLMKNLKSFKERNKLNEIDDFNPLINISIELYNRYDDILSDRFVLFNAFKNNTMIERGKNFETRVTDLRFGIYYKCESGLNNSYNCSLKEEDQTYLNYYFYINYTGFNLDHQSNSKPLEMGEDIYFSDEFPFFFDYVLLRDLYWEVVKYKEEKGISRLWDMMKGLKNEYISGYISSTESHVADNYVEIIQDEMNSSKYRLVSLIYLNNEHFQHSEYKRRHIGFLDILSTIGALFPTIKIAFIFIFQYYSKNFDGYKIIESLLYNNIQKKKIADNINNKEIELTQDYNKSSPLMNNNFHDENQLSINDVKSGDDDIVKEKNMSFEFIDKNEYKNLKKFSFIHFFFNNINCKCCNAFKQQEILSTCKEILSKYLSIESILFNQIIIENLLKDYKWNNPKLKLLDSNDLIIKLKNKI